MSVEEGYHWIKEHYFALVASIMLPVFGAVALGFIFNSFEWWPANFVLAAVAIVVGTMLLGHPVLLLGALAIGKPAIGTSTRRHAVEIYIRSAAHVIVFLGLLFLVLGLVRIERFWMIFGFLVALTIIGYLSIAEKMPPRLYRKVVVALSSVLGIVFLAGGLVYQPAQNAVFSAAQYDAMVTQDQAAADEAEALDNKRKANGGQLSASDQLRWNTLKQEKADRGLAARNLKLFQASRTPIVKNLHITQVTKKVVLTGLDKLPNGRYMFKLEGPTVMLGGQPWMLWQDARINEQQTGGYICKGFDSPPVLSFVEGTPEKFGKPQNLIFTLTWSPLDGFCD
jgi:hypothetical protein